MQKDLSIRAPSGSIEAVLHHNDTPVTKLAIVCHPNPLQDGTMDNKVVTTVARTFNALGIAAIRFNYRGVGQSTGSYGNITGEVEDCLTVLSWALQQWPEAQLWLAGFSFGSYIAAKVASQVATQQLITIAPSVDRMPYDTLGPIKCPWLVIQGENDEVVDPQAVYSWFEGLKADKTLVTMPDTGHFFHGKLIELRHQIEVFTKVVD